MHAVIHCNSLHASLCYEPVAAAALRCAVIMNTVGTRQLVLDAHRDWPHTITATAVTGDCFDVLTVRLQTERRVSERAQRANELAPPANVLLVRLCQHSGMQRTLHVLHFILCPHVAHK